MNSPWAFPTEGTDYSSEVSSVLSSIWDSVGLSEGTPPSSTVPVHVGPYGDQNAHRVFRSRKLKEDGGARTRYETAKIEADKKRRVEEYEWQLRRQRGYHESGVLDKLSEILTFQYWLDTFAVDDGYYTPKQTGSERDERRLAEQYSVESDWDWEMNVRPSPHLSSITGLVTPSFWSQVYLVERAPRVNGRRPKGKGWKGQQTMMMAEHVAGAKSTQEKRALARERWRRAKLSDDLYSGMLTVPAGEGNVFARGKIQHVTTITDTKKPKSRYVRMAGGSMEGYWLTKHGDILCMSPTTNLK